MDNQIHHENLIKGFAAQQKEIFNSNEQGVYAYLDDDHKACNRKFSEILGYGSPEEWSKMRSNFLETHVAVESRNVLRDTYSAALDKKIGTTIKVIWKKKTGEHTDSTVTMVPIVYDGHVFVLHFVSFAVK